MISLVGAAGTGKTRLSKQLGLSELKRFEGRVWFCDLSNATTSAEVLGAVSSALKVPLTHQDPEAQLAAAIRGRGRSLFILDNFEQVVDQAALAVNDWLQKASDAVFVVTSRRLLRIAGEESFHLDPLPTREACNLFYDRARPVVNPSLYKAKS